MRDRLRMSATDATQPPTHPPPHLREREVARRKNWARRRALMGGSGKLAERRRRGEGVRDRLRMGGERTR